MARSSDDDTTTSSGTRASASAGVARRDVLRAGVAASLVGAGCGRAVVASPARPADATDTVGSCGPTSRFYVGPFYVADPPERVAIHEGLDGAPLDITLRLLDAASCTPLVDVPVDVWCAAPDGWYSGVNNALVVRSGPTTLGQTWQRGRQRTDADGRVRFAAVYPGWYPVTPPHLHFTAPIDADRAFTWQLFLDDAFSDAVYTTVAPYDARGPHVSRIEDRRAALPGDLVVVPEGTAQASRLEVDVVIALDDLTRHAIPFDPVTGQGGR